MFNPTHRTKRQGNLLLPASSLQVHSPSGCRTPRRVDSSQTVRASALDHEAPAASQPRDGSHRGVCRGASPEAPVRVVPPLSRSDSAALISASSAQLPTPGAPHRPRRPHGPRVPGAERRPAPKALIALGKQSRQRAPDRWLPSSQRTLPRPRPGRHTFGHSPATPPSRDEAEWNPSQSPRKTPALPHTSVSSSSGNATSLVTTHGDTNQPLASQAAPAALRASSKYRPTSPVPASPPRRSFLHLDWHRRLCPTPESSLLFPGDFRICVTNSVKTRVRPHPALQPVRRWRGRQRDRYPRPPLQGPDAPSLGNQRCQQSTREPRSRNQPPTSAFTSQNRQVSRLTTHRPPASTTSDTYSL